MIGKNNEEENKNLPEEIKLQEKEKKENLEEEKSLEEKEKK